MPRGAKKCYACGHEFGALAWLRAATVPLSLAVALVSVLLGTRPMLQELLGQPELVVHVLACTPSEVHAVVSNIGSQPGVLMSASFHTADGQVALQVVPQDAPRFVESKTSHGYLFGSERVLDRTLPGRLSLRYASGGAIARLKDVVGPCP